MTKPGFFLTDVSMTELVREHCNLGGQHEQEP
jgi:hypothetical protein